MKLTVTIQIPEPCSQSWDEITPEASGRHCAACAKTVVDFTHMADAQILKVLRKNAGGYGRFREDQLRRELIALRASKWFSFTGFYRLAASLLLVFSAGKVAAQVEKSIVTQTDSVERLQVAPSIRVAAGVNDFSDKPVLIAAEVENMVVRYIEDQVDTTTEGHGYLKSEYLDFSGYFRSIGYYIIDGVLYKKKPPPVTKPKKWWQFWKRP